MLVLSRKVDEAIQIGDDITITVIKVKGNTVRLGISAPSDVRVMRKELEIELECESAATDQPIAVLKTDPESPPRFRAEVPGDSSRQDFKPASKEKVNEVLSRLRGRSGNDRSAANQTGPQGSDAPVNRVEDALSEEPYEVHLLRFPGAPCPANG